MKQSFRNVFHKPHTILPVIHVESRAQALENASIAEDAGCDGIFLINHDSGHRELLGILHDVKSQHPDLWIGVNCLDLSPQEAFFAATANVDGIWVDNALIDEESEEQAAATRIRSTREEVGFEGLYFGGVALKYQRKVDDLARAARVAAEYMDVVTTSGPGTGKSATVEKIKIMKDAIGDLPLTIASGIRPDNVADYLQCADCFLVATGISRTWTDLDAALTTELVKRVRA